MNREIKFRGKRVINGGWVYGRYIYGEGAYIITNDQMNYCVISLIEHLSCECYEVIPSTVGQFTGLLDKNGKEIYEGHILSISCDGEEAERHQVVWGGNEYPAFTLHPGLKAEANDFSEMVCSGYYEYEIINDNPELLKDSKAEEESR